MIETQTIERLKRMVARMETLLEDRLEEKFSHTNMATADKTERVENLLALAPIIENCRVARKFHNTIKQNNLKEKDYLILAMDMIALSEDLSDDDYKRVFCEVDVSNDLIKSVMKAREKVRLRKEAKELLWFITQGAPMFYWTEIDAQTKQQDCWKFELVKTEQDFQTLLQAGKRELMYRTFHDIRICYGTKSFYYDWDEKETVWQRFQSIAEGKEEFYDRALNLLFPDKYTVGNYYVYIPIV